MIRLYYIFKLIMRGLRLRPWGSVLTLVACWFALCQLTIIFYAVDIADRVSTMPATSGSMVAYLKDGIPRQRIADLESELRAMRGVSQVTFISRETGLRKMKEWLGPQSSMVDGVDPQILPDAFEITLQREHAQNVAAMAAKISSRPGIDDVRYRKGLIGYISGSFTQILAGASAIGAIVVVCLALVIYLSIRVGIVSRKQEIEVMGMLGANYLFMYAPYLIEAGTYGLLGTGAALATTSMTISLLHVNYSALQTIIRPLDATQVVGVLFFACSCSIIGALLAIKRSIDA